MAGIDAGVLYMYNSLVGLHPWLDRLLALFSTYGPWLFALLFARFFFSRTGQVRAMRRAVLLSVVSGALAFLASWAIARIVHRDRPFLVLPPEHLHLLVPHGADSSFPSGHAITAGAFAGGMLHAPSRSARRSFTILAVLVGVSRLVAGVHWPSDVFPSLLLGALLARLVFLLGSRLQPVLDLPINLWERLEHAVFGR